MILLLATAAAHHGTAVNQVGPGTTPLGPTVGDGARVQLGVDLWTDGFTRTLRGSQPTEEDVSVWVQQLAVQGSLHLENGLDLGLRLPVGLALTDTGEDRSSTVGPGDLALLGGWIGERLGLHGFVTLPTGAYQQDGQLSWTDLAGADGQLRLTTYDTRASLGLGSFSLGGRGDARVPLGAGQLAFTAGIAVPVGSTPDGITWGSTLDGSAALHSTDRARWGGSVRVGLRQHLADRRLALDEDLGQLAQQRSGRRTELAVGLGGRVQVAEGLRCDLGLELPVWQHVQGVQLVQTVGGRLGCRTARSLRRTREGVAPGAAGE